MPDYTPNPYPPLPPGVILPPGTAWIDGHIVQPSGSPGPVGGLTPPTGHTLPPPTVYPGGHTPNPTHHLSEGPVLPPTVDKNALFQEYLGLLNNLRRGINMPTQQPGIGGMFTANTNGVVSGPSNGTFAGQPQDPWQRIKDLVQQLGYDKTGVRSPNDIFNGATGGPSYDDLYAMATNYGKINDRHFQDIHSAWESGGKNGIEPWQNAGGTIYTDIANPNPKTTTPSTATPAAAGTWQDWIANHSGYGGFTPTGSTTGTTGSGGTGATGNRAAYTPPPVTGYRPAGLGGVRGGSGTVGALPGITPPIGPIGSVNGMGGPKTPPGTMPGYGPLGVTQPAQPAQSLSGPAKFGTPRYKPHGVY